jgi:hypothetical protein
MQRKVEEYKEDWANQLTIDRASAETTAMNDATLTGQIKAIRAFLDLAKMKHEELQEEIGDEHS